MCFFFFLLKVLSGKYTYLCILIYMLYVNRLLKHLSCVVCHVGGLIICPYVVDDNFVYMMFYKLLWNIRILQQQQQQKRCVIFPEWVKVGTENETVVLRSIWIECMFYRLREHRIERTLFLNYAFKLWNIQSRYNNSLQMPYTHT